MDLRIKVNAIISWFFTKILTSEPLLSFVIPTTVLWLWSLDTGSNFSSSESRWFVLEIFIHYSVTVTLHIPMPKPWPSFVLKNDKCLEVSFLTKFWVLEGLNSLLTRVESSISHYRTLVLNFQVINYFLLCLIAIMLSLIAVEHGYLNTQIYTTIDVNNNNYLYRDILCRCDMLVITTKTRLWTPLQFRNTPNKSKEDKADVG